MNRDNETGLTYLVDCHCSYVVTDPTVTGVGHARNDMVVTIYRKERPDIPDLSPGMPVIFRDLPVSTVPPSWNSKAVTDS